jgi:hypothetical protein
MAVQRSQMGRKVDCRDSRFVRGRPAYHPVCASKANSLAKARQRIER